MVLHPQLVIGGHYSECQASRLGSLAFTVQNRQIPWAEEDDDTLAVLSSIHATAFVVLEGGSWSL